MAIHESAFVHPSAQIDPSVEIGPLCRVDAGCVLGEGNILMQGAVLGPNTKVGKGNVFHFNCVIGHDPQFLGFDPKTNSGTIIGDGNHFREFSQVHRGLKDGQDTILGDRNFFMTTAHAGHDCVIGSDNVLANCCALGGHVEVANKCFISAFVGVHQFCRIGSFAMIGGQTAIVQDAPPYMMYKDRQDVVGINAVGLRRAGVSSEGRLAIKSAYKILFRTGLSLPHALEAIRSEWEGRVMPAEIAHLLEFCSVKSKRGICRGNRVGFAASSRAAVASEDGDDV